MIKKRSKKEEQCQKIPIEQTPEEDRVEHPREVPERQIIKEISECRNDGDQDLHQTRTSEPFDGDMGFKPDEWRFSEKEAPQTSLLEDKNTPNGRIQHGEDAALENAESTANSRRH